ncbi:sigma-70 region 4 domain-containing protein [Kitasatospora sp. NBC_00240]|uniref:AAA family ATPase n=1 Tax=Kitasatospora sp. NBC_00240 TaxID=2903567 RepID=UPI00225B08B4|nr:AAA family ATPase [Kitasatospora sp. NBC_00240]MCX5214150.1 sigma-70 region 4 domain-containing protein [Kitasatospora sp. NBC_00240]
MSVGERLSTARIQAFIGRDEELRRFAEALADDPAAPFAFYVHGPGGIGKSTLLRRLADRARAAGRPLLELDGRFVSRDPADFERAAGAFLEVPGTVLFVDSFEHCQWLESWLWQRFLPRAADGTLVVLGGRLAPQPQWTADPAWAGLLHTTELEQFSEEQARSLLAAAQIRPEMRNLVLRFAGGNPLALSLAAAAGSTGWSGEETWAPSADLLRTLLVGLIGEVPSAAHRRALEVAAQAYSTSEELLTAVLPDEDAHLLFDWLRDLPFVETTHRGLHPHDAARETLAADLRWRAPNAFVTMRQRLAEEYLRLLREAPEERVWTVTDELFHLFREGQIVARLRTWSRDDEVHDRPLQPDDVDLVLRMAEETEGAASAELVRHWVQRQPQAFSVYRLVSTGRIVAFTARLALQAPPDPVDLATDPVVAAAWAHTDATAPVAPGEHIGISRFSVYPERYQVPSRVIDLSSSRAQAESARARGRAYGFAVWRDAETWSERVKGSLADTGARPRVGDYTYGVFGVDWRRVPVETWLRHFIAATEVPAAPSGPSGFSRTAFDQAVREALPHWRDPGPFAVCALMRARLVADSDDPAEDLRALLRQAVDELARDPRGVRAREALAASYFSGAPTQEAAARRLGLPYGTYRRHLRQGLDLLCEALWQRELQGAR